MPAAKGVLKHAMELQRRNRRGHNLLGGNGRPKGARNRVTTELVERELGRIALFDPLSIYKTVPVDPNNPTSPVVFTLRALHEMPASARACIASIKLRHENLTAGDGVRDQTVEIKFWDKIKALEMCAKHLGYIDGKGATISAKELLQLLEEGRLRNANRAVSLVPPDPAPQLTAGPVIDVTPTPYAHDLVDMQPLDVDDADIADEIEL